MSVMDPGESESETPLGERTGDPWRYICTDCGSHSVFRCQGSGRIRKWRAGDDGTTFRNAGQELARQRRANYRCKNCSARLNSVYDKRAGVEVFDV